jgi:N-acyl-D-aspartate/D-glutamate deacylase
MIRHPLFCFAGWLHQPNRRPAGGAHLAPLFELLGMVHYLTCGAAPFLEEAVRKMTSLPATRFGFTDRGVVQVGKRADLVVLDYERLDNGSTPTQPLAYCRGVEQVLVNGVSVIQDGEHTGARPGRVLRRP